MATLIANAIALLIAITVHEFSHAWAAYRLGDPTAQQMGRLSLNPLVHLDPIGTLMLLTAGFGWGKAVPVNPYRLRNGPQAGMAVTSLAGPLSNLIVAALLALPLRLGLVPLGAWSSGGMLPTLTQLWVTAILLNVGLAIFNLIPLPPLDGFNVALGVLPRSWAAQLASLARYGPLLLLGLLLVGRVLPIDPLGAIMNPVFDLVLSLLFGF